MASTMIALGGAKSSLKERYFLYRGEMVLRIISRVQKLLGKEISGSPKILCPCDYYEPEESPIVARIMKVRLGGMTLDTPFERCGVTADLARKLGPGLDLDSNKDENIFVRGGITAERIKHFIKNRAPVKFFGEGRYISGAKGINLTIYLHEKVSL